MDSPYKDLKIYSKRSLPTYEKVENASRYLPPRRVIHEVLPPSSFSMSHPHPKQGAGLSLVKRRLRNTLKTTYRRSPIKPAVGRLTDLPWVARTTYRRFSEGATQEPLETRSQSAR